MESSDIACAPERGAKMWTRECNLPVPRKFSCLVTKRFQACFRGFFSMQMGGLGLKNGVPYQQMGLSTLVLRVSRRPEEQRTSFNQSIPRRFFSLASRHSTSGLHTSAERKIAISLHKRLPIPQNGILSSACASERATKMWTRACNLPVPRWFSCLATKRTKTASGFFFSMQMRGVGLKNGVPYLQMGLSTLAWRVSRRPEDKRTCFNYSIPRRFFSLASRHSTSVFFCMQNAN